MRTSFHFACVPIPQSDRYLLFQTLRGAVDIVPEDIALALKRAEGLPSASLSEADVDVLTRRGYLTETTPEQERQQSREALRITAKKLRPALELVFRFPPAPNSKVEPARGGNSIPEVFEVAAQLAGEDGLVMVSLEISAPQVDGEMMNGVLEAAAARDYPVLPEVTIAGLNALSPWLKSENFRQVALTSNCLNMPLDVEPAVQAIVGCFENQVYVSWKCVTDEMSAEQLASVQTLCERVRLKYPTFMLLAMSHKSEGTSPSGSIGHGGGLPVISSENAAVLAMLLRFISMPSAINYKPFFSVDPDRIVFDLGSAHLSYRSGKGDALIEGAEAVRQNAAGLAAKRRENYWESAATESGCPACKYALVCGNDWIGKCGHSGITECSGAFDRRLEQVLPLLLFSLRGNWRPPEANRANT